MTGARSSALARIAAGVALAAATAALFLVSRGKWSDAVIDSGREWIVPDSLSQGGLLYRDVVYWFGPFTPYFHALFFRAFGSGFGSLVLAGGVAAVATMGALYAVLRRVTGRIEAGLWAALAVPMLVFMPNAGGPLLGMGYRIWHAAAFSLLGVLAGTRVAPRHPRGMLLAAGACAGLAGLCRTEWGLAALLALVLSRWRLRRRERLPVSDALWLAAGFIAVFGGSLGYFIGRAGFDSVERDGHLLLTGLPAETRHFLLAFSGVGDWRAGLLELLYSAAMWTGLFVAASVLVSRGRRRVKTLRALGVLLALLAAAALAGGAAGAVLFSGAPLVCLAALLLGLRRRGAAAAALAACGFLGLALSYRRPFHIGDSAYVAPPLLFALVSAAGLLRWTVARWRPAPERARLRNAFAATLGGLVVLAFAARYWHYATIEAVPVAGTSGLLFARPEFAAEIAAAADAIRTRTRDSDTLVVFPEGELLNYLSGRANPIRHKLYIPGYLNEGNEARILAELRRASPAAVVVWSRPTSEYGRSFFGEDYGRSIRTWVEEHYVPISAQPAGAPPRSNPPFALWMRRSD